VPVISTIPKSRRELVTLVTTSFSKLRTVLEEAGPRSADSPCVDNWSVKDLLAVRAWWTEDVVKRIEAGRHGESWPFPAPGYKWNETPRLNNDLVRAAQNQSYQSIRARLENGFSRVLSTIDSLSDRELLKVGVFPWADKWPVSRWISINTARQYTTACSFIRKALRNRARK
jgi:hypothetical protein